MGLANTLFGSDRRVILSSVLLAILVRLIVVSSSPTFLLGGDTPGYVAYVREIISNGFGVPAVNSIHFPGSYWVYPPVLPYLWSLMTILFGNTQLTTFYVIEASGLVIDSLVIIPLYMTVKMVFGKNVGIVSSLLFAFYLPNLYALTWGGVPQLFATFLIAWVIYFTVLISREPERKYRNAIVLGAILTILTFTHDLSIWVMVFSLSALVIISLVLRTFPSERLAPEPAHLKAIITKVPIALLISVPSILIWYIPRTWWLVDAGAPYINASLQQFFPSQPDLLQTVIQGASGYFSPLGFAILLIPLAIAGIYLCVKHNMEKTGVLLVFMSTPILLSIIDFHDPIIVARMGYYTFFPSLMFTAYAIVLIKDKYFGDFTVFRPSNAANPRRNTRRLVALTVPLILISALGVSANMSSHTFYNSYLSSEPNGLIDYTTLQWIHENVPSNSTVASFGEFGYYVMGYDGNPTLVYQDLKYLTQPAEWNESIAAYSLIYLPDSNTTLTQQLISKYNISYVTGVQGVAVPSFYKSVYSHDNMTIYKVS